MRDATLCFLVRGDPPQDVLLGFKKKGFGAGKRNGIGGKIEDGEAVARAAAREMYEETGVRVAETDLLPAALLTFVFPARPEWDQVVYAFLAKTWRGEPVETDEMRPGWFPVEAIPFDQMWQDDAYWLPRVLQGERLKARFVFGEDNETVVAAEIEPWDGVIGVEAAGV